jgi:hypothetical protein
MVCWFSLELRSSPRSPTANPTSAARTAAPAAADQVLAIALTPPSPQGAYEAPGAGAGASQGAVVRPIGRVGADPSADDAETALESVDRTRAVRPGARRPPLDSSLAPRPIPIQTGADTATAVSPALAAADASPRSPVSMRNNTSAFPTQLFAHHHPFSGDRAPPFEDSLLGSAARHRTPAAMSGIAINGTNSGARPPAPIESQSAIS